MPNVSNEFASIYSAPLEYSQRATTTVGKYFQSIEERLEQDRENSKYNTLALPRGEGVPLEKYNDLQLEFYNQESIHLHPIEHLTSATSTWGRYILDLFVLNPLVSFSDFLFNTASVAIALVTLTVSSVFLLSLPLLACISPKSAKSLLTFTATIGFYTINFAIEAVLSAIRIVPVAGPIVAKGVTVSRYMAQDAIDYLFKGNDKAEKPKTPEQIGLTEELNTPVSFQRSENHAFER